MPRVPESGSRWPSPSRACAHAGGESIDGTLERFVSTEGLGLATLNAFLFKAAALTLSRVCNPSLPPLAYLNRCPQCGAIISERAVLPEAGR